ncbi:hypothetical protein [Muricoccus radiodurans]|uniref:hypothetical protein n=1 Tax=Muricoccus radiodurans TaxID=2231721 RepID=UPI003CEEA114
MKRAAAFVIEWVLLIVGVVILSPMALIHGIFGNPDQNEPPSLLRTLWGLVGTGGILWVAWAAYR